MIDIENKMFGLVKKAVQANYPQANLSSVSTNTPKAMPSVSVVEIDNYAYKGGIDSSMEEKFAVVSYEINVYTSGETKKTEEKAIINIVDAVFKGQGFYRTSHVPMSTGDDTTYRSVSRYEGIVSSDKQVYRR